MASRAFWLSGTRSLTPIHGRRTSPCVEQILDDAARRLIGMAKPRPTEPPLGE